LWPGLPFKFIASTTEYMTAYQLGLYASINAEIVRAQAMVAENQQRAALGQSMAYTDHDFHLIANQLDYLSTEARNS